MTNQNDSQVNETSGTAFSAGAQSVTTKQVTEDFRSPGSSILQAITTPGEAGSGIKKKAIVTIAGALVLIGGITAGVALVETDQDLRRSAQVTPAATPIAELVGVGKVHLFDTNWKELASQDLANLEAGDTLRVAVAADPANDKVTKARFTINGKLYAETMVLAPEINMYYYEFTIPQDQQSFSVKAELYVEGLGWIQ